MKYTFIAILLFLSSCARPACPEWYTEKECDACGRTFAILALYPENSFRELEVRFERSDCTRLFLSVFGCPLESENDQIEVTFNIDGIATRFNGTLLVGNQRVLLSDDARDLLLNALREEALVWISVGSYATCVTLTHFDESYEEFFN